MSGFTSALASGQSLTASIAGGVIGGVAGAAIGAVGGAYASSKLGAIVGAATANAIGTVLGAGIGSAVGGEMAHGTTGLLSGKGWTTGGLETAAINFGMGATIGVMGISITSELGGALFSGNIGFSGGLLVGTLSGISSGNDPDYDPSSYTWQGTSNFRYNNDPFGVMENFNQKIENMNNGLDKMLDSIMRGSGSGGGDGGGGSFSPGNYGGPGSTDMAPNNGSDYSGYC